MVLYNLFFNTSNQSLQKRHSKEEIMMHFRSSVLGLLLAVWSLQVHAFQDGQPMRFETPKMNEEEQHSIHTPKSFEMTCDACTAIAYQMSKALKKGETKKPSLKGKPLPESEIIDLLENVCEENIWESYGLKAVNGINRLSGDGLEAKDVPGMMQGGGKWPGRLSRKCSTMVGDIGEDELYSEYRKTKDLFNFLCKEYTKDCVKKDKEEL